MCSSVWWPVNDYRHYRRLSGTCKQGRRHTHVVQTAVYHTTSLETRTGSAFTVSHRLTCCRPLSLPTPYQHQQLFQNSFEKQLLRTDVTFLIGLTLSFSVCVSVCGCVGLSLTFHRVLWCKPPLSLACWPALAVHPCIIILPCFLFLFFLCKIEIFL